MTVEADRVVVDADEGNRWRLLIDDEDGNRHVFWMDATTTEVLEESLDGFRVWQAEREQAYTLYGVLGEPDQRVDPDRDAGVFPHEPSDHPY